MLGKAKIRLMPRLLGGDNSQKKGGRGRGQNVMLGRVPSIGKPKKKSQIGYGRDYGRAYGQ